MFYRIGLFFCGLLMHLLYKVRIEGKENVPRDRGFILVSNHVSNYDPLLVTIHLGPKVCYMAKAELFRNWLAGLVLRGLGAFPIERGKGDTGAIEWAEELIKRGGVLGMFPEGTRSPDGKLGRPKSGAAMIAGQTGAPILPCAVKFENHDKFRSRVTVRYGSLIENEELGFAGELAPRKIKEASRLMMERIQKLLEELA